MSNTLELFREDSYAKDCEAEVLAVNELNETFHASPAIVGDAIYLRGDEHLYCFANSSR